MLVGLEALLDFEDSRDYWFLLELNWLFFRLILLTSFGTKQALELRFLFST
jgi:hypothetical protein